MDVYEKEPGKGLQSLQGGEISLSWDESVGAPSLPNEEKRHFLTFKTGFMEQPSLDLIPSAGDSFSL